MTFNDALAQVKAAAMAALDAASSPEEIRKAAHIVGVVGSFQKEGLAIHPYNADVFEEIG